jgi:multiple sugar transport system substrate-binding protein
MERLSMKTTVFSLFSILWVVITSLPLAGAQKQITFWTTEVEKDRLEIQRDIAQEFTRKTGIGVRVIPVQENLLAERVTAAYAARSLPDVLFHPIDFTLGWVEAGILDHRSATEVVNQLGKETFGKGPLYVVRVPKEATFQPGQIVPLYIDPDRVHIFQGGHRMPTTSDP